MSTAPELELVNYGAGLAWLWPESGHCALHEPPAQSLFKTEHPRTCAVCRRQRLVQQRQIGTRQGIGHSRTPSPESPRPTVFRGRSPISSMWCYLFWLAIAIWTVFVLSSLSWKIPQ